MRNKIIKLFCESNRGSFLVALSSLYSPLWKIKETIEDINSGRLSKTPSNIRVSKLGGGKYYIIDGNHRVVEAIKRGDKQIAVVLDPHIPDMNRTGGGYNNEIKSAVQVVKVVGNNKPLEEDVRGEFWISSDGQVQSCDMDIDDMGHEGVVLERLMHKYTDLFDIDFERNPKGSDLALYEDEIQSYLMENGYINNEKEQNDFNEVPGEYAWDKYISRLKWVKENPQKIRDGLGLIWNSIQGSIKDPRDYAMKYDGEKRLAGYNIQTWNISESDLKTIGDGIYEAYGDGGEPEDLNGEEFTIEVMNPSNRMVFWNVPWEVIDSGSVSGLMMYKER
jgi:hypothetical protein